MLVVNASRSYACKQSDWGKVVCLPLEPVGIREACIMANLTVTVELNILTNLVHWVFGFSHGKDHCFPHLNSLLL